MGRLNGKVALVTGAARGIGKGIATELAREGADIVICDVLIDEASRTAGELQNEHGVNMLALEMDVTSDDSVASRVGEAISQMGKIDILVNNAGVPPDNFGADETEEDWDRCYEVNLKGIWKVTSAVVPHFKERNEGKIVNIASIAGRIGGGMAAYSASKAGAISITQSQAAEYGRFNVNVNAISPGCCGPISGARSRACSRATTPRKSLIGASASRPSSPAACRWPGSKTQRTSARRRSSSPRTTPRTSLVSR